MLIIGRSKNSGRLNSRCSDTPRRRSEEHTSELQSQSNLVCRLLLEKKNNDEHSAAFGTFLRDVLAGIDEAGAIDKNAVKADSALRRAKLATDGQAEFPYMVQI